MMIRNANRNISVAKGHGYTLEKVKFAVNFVQKSGRNTTINDWVAAYNYIKDANETAQGCQACKAAKFTAAVRNYARYGYMTLLNEGYKPEDFTDAASSDGAASQSDVQRDVERKETVKVDEISKVDAAVEEDGQDAILTERQPEAEFTEAEPEVVSTVTETANEGEPTVELPQPAKPKRVRKAKKND